MLRELRLNNLAIIKNLDLEFNEKFIALTGETGAGKSIILNGISLLIGERSHIDMIRNGEENLFAEGIFELNENQKKRLNELGFEIEDDELIITRFFDRSSKSKIMVNGKRQTLSRLKELMVNIIDLVGQHEHQFLLNNEYHLHLLDRFLNDEGKELSRKIRENVSEIKKLNLKIKNIEDEKSKIAEKKDVLEFQFNEINELDLKEDEDNELEEEYRILFNAGKISEKLEETSQLLKEGEFSILTALGRAKRNLEQLSDLSESYSELSEKIESVLYEIEEISYSVDNSIGDVEINDTKLEKIVERIDKINKLKRKYGSTITEILEFKNKIEKDLSLVNFENEELENLKIQKKELVNQYFQDSERLSEIRMKIAENLQNTVDIQLSDLNMENAKFKVEIIKKEEITAHGTDNAEFLITTNVGETFKPLAKIASGGEISRIMLALKSVFSEVDNISVLIFDEIDTGISGETVRRVAEKLRELSRNTQIICVTHSPQIAGKAQQQFFIKKEIENNFTETKVRELNTEERIREIARIISGDNITEASVSHAKEIMGLWDKKVLI
ncbi:DNA repair protein RecN [Leptotrichia buccalis]|uniref:DNA repair protein RecN n=1 Tax=Leptotrichia buccalis (strain ATCC 14201 / DSM 1135 / JCM 12969 / NCTC 10249 / C-1013-b) TaxID=523794 RepID=C7NEN3_LEPBD|nr:DNA repair protein RecN [Leptotrichia buccalis]ACV38394.1 DNA repair protein RecN [Leptotrichia buccalis C-1013-b]